MFNIKNKPLALFGIGFRGERFYYTCDKRENIKVCFDNNCFETSFHGITVLLPEKQNVSKYFIIITIEDYKPIRNQLEDFGLDEFEDFIGWEFYNRKVALIHGNCYRRIWDQCLNSSEDFKRKYTLYENPQIHMNTERAIRESALRHCDLLITQDIQADNAYGYKLSCEYIKKSVPATCKIVVIPNLFGLGGGFFPQAKLNKDKKKKRNVFPESDMNIDKLAARGDIDCTQIEKELKKDIYQKEFIISNFNKYIFKISKRELNWDIKIVDFILDKYKAEKIFFDTRHPTNIVLEEIVRRLLFFLEMDSDFQHSSDEISEEEMPVYPCVKEALELEWDIENIRNNDSKKLISGKMDMKEYIREYIFWNCEGIRCGNVKEADEVLSGE